MSHAVIERLMWITGLDAGQAIRFDRQSLFEFAALDISGAFDLPVRHEDVVAFCKKMERLHGLVVTGDVDGSVTFSRPARKVERLHDERDLMRCTKCSYVEVRLLAELRRFNELRCPKCNGPLEKMAVDVR